MYCVHCCRIDPHLKHRTYPDREGEKENWGKWTESWDCSVRLCLAWNSSTWCEIVGWWFVWFFFCCFVLFYGFSCGGGVLIVWYFGFHCVLAWETPFYNQGLPHFWGLKSAPERTHEWNSLSTATHAAQPWMALLQQTGCHTINSLGWTGTVSAHGRLKKTGPKTYWAHHPRKRPEGGRV